MKSKYLAKSLQKWKFSGKEFLIIIIVMISFFSCIKPNSYVFQNIEQGIQEKLGMFS